MLPPFTNFYGQTTGEAMAKRRRKVAQIWLNTPRPITDGEWEYSGVVGRIDEDLYERHCRNERLNEQLKKVFTTKLPLCGECLEFHGAQLSCDAVAELIDIDARLMSYAIG